MASAFDSQIADREALFQSIVRDRTLPKLFRQEVLAALAKLEETRDAIEEGDADVAAARALVAGVLITGVAQDLILRVLNTEERAALLDEQWTVLKSGLNLRRKNTWAARRRGRGISDDADELSLAVQKAATSYRREHPYDRQKRSTRRMADEIAKSVEANPHTVRGHLQRLGIK